MGKIEDEYKSKEQLILEIGKLRRMNRELESREEDVFDSRGLLERLGGDEALFEELLDIFLEDVAVRLKKLKDALEASDSMSAAREAHTILGASANIGAHRVRDVALGLEKSAKEDDLERAGPLGRKLGEEFERFKSVLAESNLLETENN